MKMRILFISGWFPYPPDNGSKIRAFNLIKGLSRRHEITLLSFVQEPVSREHIAKMEKYCQSVHAVPYIEFEPKRLRALLGFLSSQPRSVFDTYNPQMEEIVKEADRRNSFDVILASQLRSAPYALLLEHTPRIFEEVELSVIQEQFANQRNLLHKARFGLTWWKLARFLRKLLREFDGCTVVSKHEQDNVLKVVPGYSPIAIVPNGVDMDFYTGDFGPPETDTLVFTGVLTYSANLDALDFFLDKIFPLVKVKRPKVKLRITGRTDGVPIESLNLSDGVVFTGYLDDIRPCVAQSWVCVVPLRIGGGTRLKILEAMALGTPVVSTSKGAEGLEVTHGENILIVDTPAEFADAVLRLLGDKDLRAKLAENGRRLVREKYNWEHIGQNLERLLQEVVNRRKKG
ncbi:MAG: glycosyltransferase family 4 protein [Anaerolineae bacterium]